MKFFADTSNIDEIKKLKDYGLIQGVTTNPTLIAMEESNITSHWHDVVKEICEIVDGPVSAEVTKENYFDMLGEALKINEIHENVVVKLPCTPDGIRVCEAIVDKGADVNMTLCFTVGQALLAENVGALYVSPFVGRLEDHKLRSGIALVKEISEATTNVNVLAASIRSSTHVDEVAPYADVATCPPKVIWDIFKHKLTVSGLEQFEKDWKIANEDS